MPAFNFQSRFANAVEQGTKRTTIRGRNAILGTTAYLFYGMRTKACKRLGQGVIIGCSEITLGVKQDGMPHIHIRGKLLNANDRQLLATGEGFDNSRDMVDWFKVTYKTARDDGAGGLNYFKGFLIAWKPQQLSTNASPSSKRAAKTPAPRQSTGAWNQASTSLARIPKA